MGSVFTCLFLGVDAKGAVKPLTESPYQCCQPRLDADTARASKLGQKGHALSKVR